MNTYEKLLADGREMEPEMIAACLQALTRDPRFAAVVATIERIKEEAADAACQPQYSGHRGSLEHGAGMRYGMLVLLGQIRAAADPVEPGGAERPE